MKAVVGTDTKKKGRKSKDKIDEGGKTRKEPTPMILVRPTVPIIETRPAVKILATVASWEGRKQHIEESRVRIRVRVRVRARVRVRVRARARVRVKARVRARVKG